MNLEKERVLTKYIENFGNAASGAIATAGASLLIKDSSIVIENISIGVLLLIVAVAIYWVFAWIVIERTEQGA